QTAEDQSRASIDTTAPAPTAASRASLDHFYSGSDSADGSDDAPFFDDDDDGDAEEIGDYDPGDTEVRDDRSATIAARNWRPGASVDRNVNTQTLSEF
ncbi:MAG: hypothetical protein WA948_05880, partial [Pontixanthobacter sp.]